MSKILVIVMLAGCVTNNGNESGFCDVNDCECPADVSCEHTCIAGSECDIKGGPNDAVDVTCTATDTCEVECSQSASCRVDCAGRDDCQVTCPGSSCTVINIPASDPNVTCNVLGLPQRNGTTATCL